MSKSKVLIIDDEAMMIKCMLGELRQEFDVTFADGEISARDAIKVELYDIILMDGNLGRGIRGCDVVKHLRANGITTHISMFSSDVEMNEDGVNAGADSVFHKTWADESMVQRLAEHLRSICVGIPGKL